MKDLMNHLRGEHDVPAINLAGDLREESFAKEAVAKTVEAVRRYAVLQPRLASLCYVLLPRSSVASAT